MEVGGEVGVAIKVNPRDPCGDGIVLWVIQRPAHRCNTA